MLRSAQLGKKKTASSIELQRATRRALATVFEFQRVSDGVTFVGTQSEFSKKHGVSQPLASCLTRAKIISAKGWVLRGTDTRSVCNRSPVVRQFEHFSGEVFVGTQYEFRTKYSLDAGVITNLVKGANRVQSFKGWKHAGEVRDDS